MLLLSCCSICGLVGAFAEVEEVGDTLEATFERVYRVVNMVKRSVGFKSRGCGCKRGVDELRIEELVGR